MNRWRIPVGLEEEVIKRDWRCVYCGTAFVVGDPNRGRKASWEHILNDATIISPTNIARCCVSCNASKGAKPLRLWLESTYCKRRGINPSSVADVVRSHLQSPAPIADAGSASDEAQARKVAASGSSGSRSALVRMLTVR